MHIVLNQQYQLIIVILALEIGMNLKHVISEFWNCQFLKEENNRSPECCGEMCLFVCICEKWLEPFVPTKLYELK
jgi:hypothetical protein